MEIYLNMFLVIAICIYVRWIEDKTNEKLLFELWSDPKIKPLLGLVYSGEVYILMMSFKFQWYILVSQQNIVSAVVFKSHYNFQHICFMKRCFTCKLYIIVHVFYSHCWLSTVIHYFVDQYLVSLSDSIINNCYYDHQNTDGVQSVNWPSFYSGFETVNVAICITRNVQYSSWESNPQAPKRWAGLYPLCFRETCGEQGHLLGS